MESQASQRRVKPRAREVCAVEDLDKKSAEEKAPSGGKRSGPLLVQCYGCHERGHIRLDSPREPEGRLPIGCSVSILGRKHRNADVVSRVPCR